jgi:head-tail adaptor
MYENLALEEKAATGDSVSIEVLRSMRSESQRELEAVNAQSQYTSNGDDSSFDMEEDLQENTMEPPVLGDSKADNEADNDRLPIPMWQTLLPMEGDTAASTSSFAKSTARG